MERIEKPRRIKVTVSRGKAFSEAAGEALHQVLLLLEVEQQWLDDSLPSLDECAEEIEKAKEAERSWDLTDSPPTPSACSDACSDSYKLPHRLRMPRFPTGFT